MTKKPKAIKITLTPEEVKEVLESLHITIMEGQGNQTVRKSIAERLGAKPGFPFGDLVGG